MNFELQLLQAVLGGGSADYAYLEEMCDKWNQDIYNIVEEVKDNFGEFSFSDIMYTCYSRVFYDAMEELQAQIDYIDNDYLKDILQERKDEIEIKFAPYINYLDSWFNNWLDNIDGIDDVTVENFLKHEFDLDDEAVSKLLNEDLTEEEIDKILQ